jgi:hypothetical protein
MRILESLILSGTFLLAACAHAPEAEAPATVPAPDPAAKQGSKQGPECTFCTTSKRTTGSENILA